MTDEKLHKLTITALALVALIAAIVSFIHIYTWATGHHQLSFAAALYPFSVDALFAVTTFSMFRSANRGTKRIPWQIRTTFWLAVMATLAANFGYGMPYGIIAALISCWPAVAFMGAVECAVKMARKTSGPEPVKVATPQITAVVTTNGSKPKPQAVKAVRKAKRRSPSKDILTNARAAEIAAQRGVTPRTVRNHPEWWKVPEVVN